MPASRPTDPPDRVAADLPADKLQQAAAVLGLLSATVRLHLVWVLAQSEQDVTTLAATVGHTVPTVSHHLSKLKLAGIVRANRAGKRQIYQLTDPLAAVVAELAIGHHVLKPLTPETFDISSALRALP